MRFRCRVGHVYSPETMIAAQTDEVDRALWVALRTLEERAAMAYRLAPGKHGQLIGVVAGFPVREGDRLSRRFIRLTLPRVAPWRLHKTFAHLYAAGGVPVVLPLGVLP